MKVAKALQATVLVGAFAHGPFGLSATSAAPVLMSAEWAAQACAAWNEDPILTEQLLNKWIKNDQGRGYKIMHLYRLDCTESPRVELRVSEKNGKAMCVYGGKIKARQLNRKSDYLMWAKTSRWEEMGAGRYGPLRALATLRLKLRGPRLEALRHLAPLKEFLLLTGKVLSDTSTCP